MDFNNKIQVDHHYTKLLNLEEEGLKITMKELLLDNYSNSHLWFLIVKQPELWKCKNYIEV